MPGLKELTERGPGLRTWFVELANQVADSSRTPTKVRKLRHANSGFANTRGEHCVFISVRGDHSFNDNGVRIGACKNEEADI